MLTEPVQWQLQHGQFHHHGGSYNHYHVCAAGYVVKNGGLEGPQWIRLRQFIELDDASQLILDMQAGRWRPEQVFDWSPGSGPRVGERVETVDDLHVSRVVRGAARARKWARR